MTSLTAALTGFTVGIGLLTSIGPQNLALIRISVDTTFGTSFAAICLTCHCSLLFVALTWPGLVAPSFLRATTLAGVLFLSLLGLRAARDAITPPPRDPTTAPSASTRWEVIWTALILSLLNPEVYLDVVVALGGLAASLPEQLRLAFAAGNAIAATTWFLGVHYTATRTQHLLRRPVARRALSATAAVSLFATAAWFALALQRSP